MVSGLSCASVESPKKADDLAMIKESVWELQKQTAELGILISENGNGIAMLAERMNVLEEEAKKAAARIDSQPAEQQTPAPQSDAAGKTEAEPAGKAETAPDKKSSVSGGSGGLGMMFNAIKKPFVVLASSFTVGDIDPEFKKLDEEDMYKESMNLFNQGEYSRAAAGFTFFIRRFPRSPLASGAQYWKGEIYYSQKDYARAAHEFKRVMVLYSKSQKVPDAMLKYGYCKIKLGTPARGAAIFQEVIDKHPSSVAAATARRELEKMKNNKDDVGSKSGDG